VQAGDCSRSPYLEKDGTLWWGIAAGLLFTTEFILVYWGLEFTNASRLVSFNFLTPIFGVIAGAVLLNEPISDTLLLTLFLVGTGIYLVSRPTYVCLFYPSTIYRFEAAGI